MLLGADREGKWKRERRIMKIDERTKAERNSRWPKMVIEVAIKFLKIVVSKKHVKGSQNEIALF